jgi:probable rRNA maturation factor
MPTKIDLQNDECLTDLPAQQDFEAWVNAALMQSLASLEQTIRVVGEAESRALNSQYRQKDVPTNVLSFASENEYLDYDCLGDLVICAPIVGLEAKQQGKTLEAHWAHMVVHGMLHLQGYDHQNKTDADKMESQEIKILATLGYTNPYNN